LLNSFLIIRCLWSNRCRTCTCRTFSDPMRHPFRNNASHINLWDAWFPNCPSYFGQPENDDRYVLSGAWLLGVFHSWFRQHNPFILWHIDIGHAIGEQQGYATEIMNKRYTSQITCDNRYSYVGLEHILHNRVLNCHLSSLTLYI
jgi:hypothetical protein